MKKKQASKAVLASTAISALLFTGAGIAQATPTTPNIHKAVQHQATGVTSDSNPYVPKAHPGPRNIFRQRMV